MAVVYLAYQVSSLVREARKKIGITQAELAKLAGVSRQLVMGLESGKATGIGLDKLLHILEVLNLSMSIQPVGDATVDAERFRPFKQDDPSYAKAFDDLMRNNTMAETLFPPGSVFADPKKDPETVKGGLQ